MKSENVIDIHAFEMSNQTTDFAHKVAAKIIVSNQPPCLQYGMECTGVFAAASLELALAVWRVRTKRERYVQGGPHDRMVHLRGGFGLVFINGSK